MSEQREHVIRESTDKIRAETQVKRGTGTRDQDTIKVKVRGDEPGEVVAKLNETITLLETTAENARAIQPSEHE